MLTGLNTDFVLCHQTQPFQLAHMLLPGGDEVDTRRVHTAVTQHVRQTHNVLVDTVEGRGKQVAQIVSISSASRSCPVEYAVSISRSYSRRVSSRFGSGDLFDNHDNVGYRSSMPDVYPNIYYRTSVFRMCKRRTLPSERYVFFIFIL